MGLKILHSADWHMDSAFVGFSDGQREFLRGQQRQLPGKIAELCIQEKCDLLLLAGDIFDGIPSRDAVDCVKTALAECNVPVFVSPGNHDFCGLGSPWLEEAWPENVHVFKSGMESVSLPGLNCRIYGAGYSSMDCKPLLENFHTQGEEAWQIGLLHGDPVTVHSPYCPITAGQIRESGFQYLALGHIHKAGSVQQGKTVCGWPGCPMGRGWDETGEKGVYLITLEENVTIEFLPLGMPQFHDTELEVSGTGLEELEGALPAVSRDFYRMTLTGQAEVDLEELQQHFSGIPNLFLRDRTEDPVDIWAEVGEDNLRGVYFRILQDLAQTEPEAKLTAELSWKILSGREVKLP